MDLKKHKHFHLIFFLQHLLISEELVFESCAESSESYFLFAEKCLVPFSPFVVLVSYHNGGLFQMSGSSSLYIVKVKKKKREKADWKLSGEIAHQLASQSGGPLTFSAGIPKCQLAEIFLQVGSVSPERIP